MTRMLIGILAMGLIASCTTKKIKKDIVRNEKKEMVRELRERFPTSRFQKIIVSLEQVTF